MQGFMQGRYGRDELSMALNIAAIICLILSFFRPLRFFIYIALVVIIWSITRSYSKNKAARVKELNAYYKLKNTVTGKIKLFKGMWRDRNTHLYCKCPNCKTVVRIKKPEKGKNILITCQRCKNSFEKRT